MRPTKILCIGRNYAAHAREMAAEVPAEPLVFLKPPSALIETGGTIVLPRQSSDIHHELELVAMIGRGGKDIPEAGALDHVAGYALGLDLTARDIQAQAKKTGAPWSVAKGFDTFAPVGPITPAGDVGDPQSLDITLQINGETRQRGHTSDMLFSVADLVSYLSTIFTLEEGDLVFTGTPEGVGPIRDGDRLEATGARLAPLQVMARAQG